MKKLLSFLLAMTLCLSLAACGGPDKKAAIDAQSRAKDIVNELSSILNQDPETFADYIAELIPMAETLNDCAQALAKQEDLTQEEIDQWEATCNEIYDRAKEIQDYFEN